MMRSRKSERESDARTRTEIHRGIQAPLELLSDAYTHSLPALS